MTLLAKERNALEVELEIARKQASGYAMALDLLARLSHSDSEKQAVAKIIELFTVLFSPQNVQYFSLTEGKKAVFYSSAASNNTEEIELTPSALFSETNSWTESIHGFSVRISHRGEPLGIVLVQQIAFPEHKEQYLNLALAIVDVCGLVIENARKQEMLKKSEQFLRQEKEKVEQALAQVQQLSGLLPICMHCKKIRDDQGYWNKIETYIQAHSEAEFSHGICEECLNKYYPD